MPRPKSSTSSYATAFGKALDEQLSRRQMRPSELAQKLGVTQSYVSRVMSGSTTPSPASVSNFAAALNSSPTELSSLMGAAAQTKGYLITGVCPHCGKKLDG